MSGERIDDAVPDDGAEISRLLLAAAVLLLAIGGAVDLATDARTVWHSAHAVFELTLMALGIGIALYLWHGWWRASRSLANAHRVLAERQAAMLAEREAWRRSARSSLDELARAIDAQLDAWKLTPAEREVALLLLEGHGHKQVAALTGRSERTVRQHAVSVYQKAGLSGRAELAAFFLEGLTTRARAERRAGAPAG